MGRASSVCTASAAAALIAAGLLGFAPTSARSSETAPRPEADEPDLPNVPDRNGCVKLCDLDMLPCDPPLYKKLDGRCTLKN